MHCGESACQVTKESQRQVSNPYGPPDVKMFCDVICTSCGKLNTTGNAHTIDPKKRAKWDAIERHNKNVAEHLEKKHQMRAMYEDVARRARDPEEFEQWLRSQGL